MSIGGEQMAIKEIAMNTEILQNDIIVLETTLETIKNKTENMFNNMKALDMMWEGVTNQVFMIQFTNDYNQMKELCSTLEHLLESLRTAKKEYEQCESNVNLLIKDIQVQGI